MRSEQDLDLTNLSSEENELFSLLLQAEGIESNEHLAIPRRADANQAMLSFAQQRLWYLEQLLPGSSLYTIPFSIRLRGKLDVDALQCSLRTIIQRHEILRTTFVNRDGEPWQLINPAPTSPLTVLDIRSAPLGERQRQEEELAEQEARHVFDLSQGPLLRALLLRLEEEEWRLLLTFHHIIFDGWSIGVFCQELASCYEAYWSGDQPALAPLPIQYADYAIWQRERERQGAYAEQRAYWQKQVQDAPALLELPTDYVRPAISNFAGAWEPVRINRDLTARLQQLARQEGCSLFMVLLAAWFTLLHRYSGQEDLIVGAPIANRTRLETEQLIGFFVNTLALRVFLGDNPDFRALLKRVREVTLQAYAYQDLPFEQVVKLAQHSHELSHMPLVQAFFVLQNTPDQQLHLPDLELEWTMGRTSMAKFDIFLDLTETADGLQGALEYSTELFTQSRMQRLPGHLETLLQAIVNDPSCHLSALPILTEAEQRQLLIDWNDTCEEYPLETCVHQLIEAQVEQTPTATAVVFENQQLTYQQLNRRSNQVADLLQKHGVGPETLVGVCMERSLELVVALLGVLKAGGAYVPLDPTYPRERLVYMIQDAHLPLLFTQRHLREALPERNGTLVVSLDTDIAWDDTNPAWDTNPSSGVQPDNAVYMIYTSGSTGQPKGVVNMHRGLTNRLCWSQHTAPYQLTPQDSVMQKTPFSFDVSVWEFFWPLIAGARLVLARPGGHQDAAYLVDLIAEQQITTLHFVSSMLHAFLLEPDLHRCESLRQVLCSGEALPAELQEQFFARFAHTRLHNLYGPTEAAIEVTYWQCQRNSKDGSVPIGRPIANTQIYLLDRAMQPVPIGVAGELYIGGVNVARGYYQRPELTAQKFIPDPFRAGMRLFKTGDLARYRSDGAIEFLGRIDYQVKIRGFRIEPGEIEATLSQHPAVKEVVVVAREDTPGEKRLVAYLVLDHALQQQELPVEELRDFLKTRLPHYMIPAAFVHLSALPLTTNGKVNRKALPMPSYKPSNPETAASDVPAYARPALTTPYVLPRNDVERSIAGLWEEYLGVTHIGVYDRFDDLGGDSLLVLQIISRLHMIFGIRLSVRDFLAAPTVADIAIMIKQKLSQLIDSEVLEKLLVELESQG